MCRVWLGFAKATSCEDRRCEWQRNHGANRGISLSHANVTGKVQNSTNVYGHQNSTAGGEGVEVLVNKPFEDKEFGRGQYILYKAKFPLGCRLSSQRNIFILRRRRGIPIPIAKQATCDPVMSAHKLVTVDVPYWGLGYRLDQALLETERSLFSENHKRCCSWIDEWFGLTYDDVRRMEMQNDIALNQVHTVDYASTQI